MAGNAVVYQTSAGLSSLYKKTNTAIKTAIKVQTDEYDWFDDIPDEEIEVSANEMRIVVDVLNDTNAPMIPEGGYEGVLTSVAPVNGTLTPVQMNKRYSITTLYQEGWKKSGQIKNQVVWQATKAVESMAEKIGLQTYGFSTGTMALVHTTGVAATSHADLRMKDAFGTTQLSGGTAAEQAYFKQIFRPGMLVALIRAGAIVEFGTYVGVGASGSNYGSFTWNASCTPTANDIIIQAGTVIDSTLAGTDQNRWPVGLLDAILSTSVHGISGSTYPNWSSYVDSSGGAFTFTKLERMQNEIGNRTSMQGNVVIMSQGVRRSVIETQLAMRRYAGAVVDLDGDLKKSGVKLRTSRLAPPGMVFCYAKEAYRQKMLTEKPAYAGGPGMFSLDKVENKGAVAASINLVYFRSIGARGAMALATGCTET